MAQSSRVSVVPAERRRRILEQIQVQRSGKIEELALALGVSEATVRRDLAALAAEGVVDRTHGGAVLPASSTAFERLYAEKRIICQEEKRRIGLEAAAMVSDGETLILDAGSTTFEIARNLTERNNLTIITYDLFIASGIGFGPGTTVMVAGGVRREGFSVLVGPVTEEFLRQVRVNRAFLGADAVDLTFGVSNATYAEVSIKRLIIQAAKEVVLVTDHTKFGNVALAKVCDLDQIHRVVTDSGVETQVLQGLKRLGLPASVA